MPRMHPEHVLKLFELAREMLCVANLDGRVTLLNPAWEQVTGHTPDELFAAPFIEFVHPEDQEAFREEFRGLRNGRPVLDFQARFRCADQTYRWLLWGATPADGHAYAVARDVTEQHDADQRVEQYQRSLRRNAAMIDASLAQAREMLRQLQSLHRAVVLSLQAAEGGEIDALLDSHREAAA